MVLVIRGMNSVPDDCQDVTNLAKGLNMDLVQPDLFNSITTDCCLYTSCSGNNVVGIYWHSLGLNGTLNSTAIPNTVLRFDIFANKITGNIPEFKTGIHLANLNAYVNDFSGTLPSIPPSLVEINLVANKLSGIIPAIPAGMTYFHAWGNQLSGLIPSLPSSLRDLNLHTNKLSGELPLIPPSLTRLYVEINYFLNGTILLYQPIELASHSNQFTNITIIDPSLLYGCNIDSNYIYASDVQNLVGHCSMSNLLPEVCKNITIMARHLNMENVNPTQYSKIKSNCCQSQTGVSCVNNNVVSLDWHNMGLSGSLDVALLPDTVLDLDFQNNVISGDISSLSLNIQILRMNDNRFTGTIILSNPSAVYVQNNNFTNITILNTTRLSNCSIVGNPMDYNNMNELRDICLKSDTVKTSTVYLTQPSLVFQSYFTSSTATAISTNYRNQMTYSEKLTAATVNNWSTIDRTTSSSQSTKATSLAFAIFVPLNTFDVNIQFEMALRIAISLIILGYVVYKCATLTKYRKRQRNQAHGTGEQNSYSTTSR